MTYAVFSLRLFCSSESVHDQSPADKAYFIHDMVLGVALGILGTLILTGATSLGGQGIVRQMGWICAGEGLAYTLSGGSVLLIRLWKKQEAPPCTIESKRPEIRAQILNAEGIFFREEQKSAARQTPCHHILGGLYLGNTIGFVESSGLSICNDE